MPSFRDPAVAYTAADNFEAHFLCQRLVEAGIEAMVIEDVSQDATFGVKLAAVHKPQVWVERTDLERAQPVVHAHERRSAELHTPTPAQTLNIEVVCEECGVKTVFPGSLNGSVQECPHCGAYVDVGEDAEDKAWAAEAEAAAPPESETADKSDEDEED